LRSAFRYTVDSVDRAAAKATELGGAVHMPPTDIPGVGRFAVVGDPQGAVFSPFTDASAADAEAAPAAMPAVGGVAWNELQTADVASAKAFYGAVVGWDFNDQSMGGSEPYTLLIRGEQMEGGMFRKPDEMPASLWIIYFHTADLDHSLAAVTRLGGQPVGEIIPVPTVGRISWATDPTGALFGLLEPAR
jgi:predicted enzyme related to lactoylglutathione lyase